MIVKPKTRGFICTTAHPVGCLENVRRAADYAKEHPGTGGPKGALVIGASTGYGLAGRIAAAFSYGAPTVGVFFERPGSGNRTATAGWYNNQAFEKLAAEAGIPCKSINGDAFSQEIKEQTIAAVRETLPDGKADLVIYSLAAPKRTDPAGKTWTSAIKPLGQAFTGKTVDFHTGAVTQVEIAPGTPEEAEGAVAVMGGEDWLLWMEALKEAGVLTDGACTLALSYIGPALTHAIYKDGTIGKAKEDLEKKAGMIDALLSPTGGKAFVSVNKALVTQASAAIPVVPLYVSLLFKIMKEKGTHEDCIGQMVRLFNDRLYKADVSNWKDVPVDDAGRIRIDDWEMDEDVQAEIAALWEQVNTDNLPQIADLKGYQEDFFSLFGFGVPGVDYDADVEV